MDWSRTPLETTESPRGAGAVWVPVHGVVVTRARGYGDLALIRTYTRLADRAFTEGGRWRAFHHWLEIEAFEPAARAYLRGWAASRASNLADAHYLLGSRVLAMAVSIAALALGRELVSYTDEARFEGMLDEAVREASGKPRGGGGR